MEAIFVSIILNNLSFGYITPLISELNCVFEHGWSAVVGINGSGKTTLLRLITGELQPDAGSIQTDGDIYYCRQIIDAPPTEAAELYRDFSSRAWKLKTRFGLGEDWPERWGSLSFGEQKRVQIASAFYTEPEILILDEPTNHLDAESRELLVSGLRNFRGTGIIVSHDRQLLDRLPYQTLFLEPPEWDLRKQNYSEAAEIRNAEASYEAEQKAIIGKKVKQLKKQASHYRSRASAADKNRSKKNINRKDHDAKFKMDVARITGKDAVHGKLLNQMQGRIKQEEEKLSGINTRKKASFDFSLHFEPGRHKTLFMIEEGSIKMGEITLSFGSIELGPEEKASLSGVNGCGKSTLLRHIYSYCRKDKTLFIPQELEKSSVRVFFSEMNNLTPAERGEIFSIYAALGSSPERVIEVEKPSPGEIRKLLIADAVRKKYELLILDEPTNHLDLHSIEALETALKEYRAGLVLVSHDNYFLKNTTSRKWRIDNENDTSFRLIQ